VPPDVPLYRTRAQQFDDMVLDAVARLEPRWETAAPSRIIVYRRPLMARAEDDDELSDLVFDVVVEEFAQILGLDPEAIDPGYRGGFD